MKKKLLSYVLASSVCAASVFSSVPLKENPRTHIWSKTIGSGNEEVNAITSITVGGTTRMYVTGTFSGTISLPTSTSTISLTSAGGSDIFIGSYDPDNGNFFAATRVGGTGNEIATGIACIAASGVTNHSNVRVMVSANCDYILATGLSNIGYISTNGAFSIPSLTKPGPGFTTGITTNGTYFYAAGCFYGALSFPKVSGSPFTMSLSSTATREFFACKLLTSPTITSNLVYCTSTLKPFSTIGQSAIGAITYAPNGRLYVTGTYTNSLRFNSNIASLINTPVTSGAEEIFVASIDPAPLAQNSAITFNLNDQKTSSYAGASAYIYESQKQTIIANTNGVYITAKSDGQFVSSFSFNGVTSANSHGLSFGYTYLVKYAYATASNLGLATHVNIMGSNSNVVFDFIKSMTSDGNNLYLTGTSDDFYTSVSGTYYVPKGGALLKFNSNLGYSWGGQIADYGSGSSEATGNAIHYSNCRLYLGGAIEDLTGTSSNQIKLLNFGNINTLTRNGLKQGLLTSLSPNISQSIASVGPVCFGNFGSGYSLNLGFSSDVAATYTWTPLLAPPTGTFSVVSGATNSFSITFSIDGDYTINLTVNNGSCTSVYPIKFQVRKDLSLLVSPNATVQGCSDGTTSGIVPMPIGNTSIAGVTYAWSGPVGGFVGGITNVAQPTINKLGLYTVIVSPISGAAVCGGPVTRTVNVVSNPTCNGRISGNGNNVSQSDISTEERMYSIYPNPTSGKLNIDLSQSSFVDASINIVDISGKKIVMEKLSAENPNNTLDISKLNNGIYFYELNIDGKQMKKQRVVLQK